MRYKGLAKAMTFRTEEDVLRHCYGQDGGGPESAATDPAPAGDSLPPSVEELAAKLESENTKAVLVELCSQAGLDSGGTKAELALRLAEHHLSS